MSTFAPTLQAFFTQHLIDHRRVSTHTVTAYRDTCKLLLAYAQRTTGITPSKLTFTDLDAPLVSGFLDHLQRERGNNAARRTPLTGRPHRARRQGDAGVAPLWAPQQRRHRGRCGPSKVRSAGESRSRAVRT